MLTFRHTLSVLIPAAFLSGSLAFAGCNDEDTVNPATTPAAGNAGKDATTTEGGGHGSDGTEDGGGGKSDGASAGQEGGGDANAEEGDAAVDGSPQHFACRSDTLAALG